jgi:ElaB/YqjD/DUF883 family membrane-anchored ribosome-binding protein
LNTTNEDIMAAKRKKADTVESRLDSLVADLEALQADVRGLAKGARAEAGDRIADALKAAEDRVTSALNAAQDAAAQAVDQAEVWATDNAESLREAVREQPLYSVAVAMGIGAVLGALFLRR